MQTVLIAIRRTGGAVMLAVPEVPLAKQNEQLQKLFTGGSDDFSKVGVYFLEPKQVLPLAPAGRVGPTPAAEPPKTPQPTTRKKR